ncbi:MAG: hypothetical protein ACE15B_16370 [Bryobacteraceae bacterium]
MRTALLTLCLAARAWSAAFGDVVVIGGQASDICLDEARGVLYIANSGAGRIDVMTLAERSLSSAIHVAPEPSGLALSPNGRYLVATHRPGAVTILDRDAGLRRTFNLPAPGLGVAFGRDGLALVATSADILLLDPVTGVMERIGAVPEMTAPWAALGASGDGGTIFGLTENLRFTYTVGTRQLLAARYTATPPMGPRALSASRDGSYYAAGWAVFARSGELLNQFMNPAGLAQVGSLAVDSGAGLIYAQVPEAGRSGPPVLAVVDAATLALRDRVKLAENLAGRSVWNAAGDTIYAVSESGVTVLPVGALARAPRLAADREDLVFRAGFCNRGVLAQEFRLHGAGAPFRLSTDTPGVRIAPVAGVTPAAIRVEVDGGGAQRGGTVQALIHVESPAAVNVPAPLRVIVNQRAPEQRGWFVNLPGTLADLLADPVRDRFYVVRQDRNEVLVFDATTLAQVAALPTYNTPTQAALTRDRKHLLVGHENAALAAVFDLDTLEPLMPVRMPSGHYPRSVAVSNRAILAACRVAGGPNTIDRIDFTARRGVTFKEEIHKDTVLAASPSGSHIVAVSADGSLLLYEAAADAFTVARKEAGALAGAYTAGEGWYVAGDTLLNASLVPVNRFETAGSAALPAAGGGVRITAGGAMERFDTGGRTARAVPLVEQPAPALPLSAFRRGLAALANGNFAALTISGVTLISPDYDAPVPAPRIDRVASAADGAQRFAPGSLISLFGANLNPANAATREIPLPAAIGESCLTVNGAPAPMMFASPAQVNAQLPFDLAGRVVLTLRTPGGASDDFIFNVQPAAPGLFLQTSGPLAGVAAIVRAKNGELVTPSNPIHPGDQITIWAAGMGRTAPEVPAGTAAPGEPPAHALIPPEVRLGGAELEVLFAGLAPGQVGVYQINARVPEWVSAGAEVPLVIAQGAAAAEARVRVVR